MACRVDLRWEGYVGSSRHGEVKIEKCLSTEWCYAVLGLFILGIYLD